MYTHSYEELHGEKKNTSYTRTFYKLYFTTLKKKTLDVLTFFFKPVIISNSLNTIFPLQLVDNFCAV